MVLQVLHIIDYLLIFTLHRLLPQGGLGMGRPGLERDHVQVATALHHYSIVSYSNTILCIYKFHKQLLLAVFYYSIALYYVIIGWRCPDSDGRSPQRESARPIWVALPV